MARPGDFSLPDDLLLQIWSPRTAFQNLNPAAACFSPGKFGGGRGTATASTGAAVPMGSDQLMQVLAVTNAALEGKSFLPWWSCQGPGAGPAQPQRQLVMAEALDGPPVYETTLSDVHAACSAANLFMVFVPRAQLAMLARVDELLKRSPSAGAVPPPSVLRGAVVRVLMDRVYRLRVVQETVVQSGQVFLVLNVSVGWEWQGGLKAAWGAWVHVAVVRAGIYRRTPCCLTSKERGVRTPLPVSSLW